MNARCAVLAAALCLGCAAGSARAQGTGRSLDIDLSIRSSGAGGASNAVFWGGDPNHWANPALLGYARGTSFTWGRTELVPDLADDVVLESKRFGLSMAGIGLVTAGKGPGEIRLDYGMNEGRDESGNFTGFFDSFETIESWGVGVSLADLIATLAGPANVPFTRYADIAFGYASKDVVIDLAPGMAGAVGRGTGIDHGLLVRVSPLVRDSGPDGASLPARVDLSYGWSVLNANDEQVVFLNASQASPLTRMHRNGMAVRIALGLPAHLREGASPRRRWILDGLEPLVSVGVARDWEHNSAGGQGSFFDVDRNGLEVVVANVLAWRIGHVSDRLGDIVGGTSGWGAGLHLGRVVGFRYDEATIPQAQGLAHVRRKGVTTFVDLMALLPGRAGRDAAAW